jgi:hypothetical protein
MKEVYFDTNIYTHIYNRQREVTDADVEKLFAAVRADKLRIYTSTQVLEETISAIPSAEKEALGRLKLIRKLVKHKRIVKYHYAILEDDITAYAKGQQPPSPFMSPPPGLKPIFKDHGAENVAELRQVAVETQKQIRAFKQSMQDAFTQIIHPLAMNAPQTFEDYWNYHSASFTETLAKKVGVYDECLERGLAGLLDLRSVRHFITAQVSLGYAQTYERIAFERGNSRDMQHAVLSSTTDALITHDDRFRQIMTRRPLKDFAVLDLKGLLAR